jgi:hypothetical protein
MPSSPNYKRNYKQEMATASARGEDKDRALRNRARRHAAAAGRVKKGDSKDVDHVKPLRSGGSGRDHNTRVRSVASNRSDNGHTKRKK